MGSYRPLPTCSLDPGRARDALWIVMERGLPARIRRRSRARRVPSGGAAQVSIAGRELSPRAGTLHGASVKERPRPAWQACGLPGSARSARGKPRPSHSLRDCGQAGRAPLPPLAIVERRNVMNSQRQAGRGLWDGASVVAGFATPFCDCAPLRSSDLQFPTSDRLLPLPLHCMHRVLP